MARAVRWMLFLFAVAILCVPCASDSAWTASDETEPEAGEFPGHASHAGDYSATSDAEDARSELRQQEDDDFADDDGSAGQNNPEALQEFLQWAEEEGVSFGPSPKVQLVYQPGMGLSIVATENIEPSSTVLLSVPIALAFSDFNMKDTRMARALKSVPLAKKETKLAMLLLSEMFDVESLWYPWFQLLPNRLDCAVFWSEAEMDELDSSNIVGETLRFNLVIKSEYEKLNVPHMKRRYPDAFSGGIYSFSQFKWAFMIISSRGFTMFIDNAPKKVLVPFIDFLNHHQSKSISFVHIKDTEEIAESLDDLAQRYSLAIVADNVSFAKGEQIFLFYKDHPNENLLLHYGFVLEENLNDVFYIRLNFKGQQYPRKNVREHLIKLRGIDQLHKFEIRWKEPVIDPDLFFVVRVMAADDEQLDYLVREGVASDALLTADSEVVAATHIRLSLEKSLLGFTTTVMEDEEIIRSLDKKLAARYSRTLSRQRSAVVFRLGQKKLLLHAIDWLFKYAEDVELRKQELDAMSPYLVDSRTVKPVAFQDVEY